MPYLFGFLKSEMNKQKNISQFFFFFGKDSDSGKEHIKLVNMHHMTKDDL